MRRFFLISAVVALSLAGAAQAPAAVTIGQTVDASASSCDANADILQVTVASGTSYVTPGTGTITSWSTLVTTPPADQQWSMKMFRKVGEPATYQVVGHSTPQTITSGGPGLKTFPASIPVKPGDVLGLHTVTDNSNCAALEPTSVFAALLGDLSDGGSDSFEVVSGARLDIAATFVPQNTFVGKPKVKRKKNGTATVTLNLPNPGTLSASGGGAKISKAKSVPAGKVKLKVKAKGSKLGTLNQSGQVTLKLKLSYTPTGGDPHTEKLKVRLRKG